MRTDQEKPPEQGGTTSDPASSKGRDVGVLGGGDAEIAAWNVYALNFVPMIGRLFVAGASVGPQVAP